MPGWSSTVLAAACWTRKPAYDVRLYVHHTGCILVQSCESENSSSSAKAELPLDLAADGDPIIGCSATCPATDGHRAPADHLHKIDMNAATAPSLQAPQAAA
ncbi:hypothetical protein ABZP36_013824 [Zizania latifolia]